MSLSNLIPGAAVTVSVQALEPDGQTKDGDPKPATFTEIGLVS